MPLPDKERRALRLACLLGVGGVLWAIWSVPLVLTNDGPQAVLIAHMEAHYDDPGSIYARQFSTGFGLSGRGFSMLYGAVSTLFSWPNSLRVSQAVMVLALAFGAGWLCRAVSKNAPFAVLLGFLLAFSWPFYMGFYAFTCSMALGLMVLAFVVSRSDGLSRVEQAAVTTALIVQLVMHGFAIFVTLLLVALVVIARLLAKRKSTPADEWRKLATADAVWMGVSFLPSVVVFLLLRTAQPELAKLAGAENTEWIGFGDLVMALPRMAVPGSTLLGITVFALAFVALVRTALRLRKGPRRPEEAALFFGGVGLLFASLVLPLNIPGWQFFSPRFLTVGLAVALSLVACEPLERRGLRLAFDVAMVALVAGAMLSARALHRRLATACEDALAGLEHIVPRTFVQLPITFDATCGLPIDAPHADVPFAASLVHFSSLFAVTHGGTVPYVFSGPAAMHAFVPRDTPLVPIPSLDDWGLSSRDPRLVNAEARSALLTKLMVYGASYENVLFFGSNAQDRALLLDRGFVTDYAHGSFVNAHFDPCRIELVLDVHPNDPPVLVRAGFGESEVWNAAISPLPPVGDRRPLLASLRTFCGDVWARVEWQNSDEHCAHADAQGHIAVHAARPLTRITCERR